MEFKVKYGRARAAGVCAWATIVLALGFAAAVPSTALAGTAKPRRQQVLHQAGRSVKLTPPRDRPRALRFTRVRPGHLYVGPPRASTSIIGGTDAVQGELGFLAFVAYLGQDSTTVCSGTVVAANVILTAAHCVLDDSNDAVLDPSGFRVVTGSVDWTTGSARQVNGVS
jgi:hypothetical protein